MGIHAEQNPTDSFRWRVVFACDRCEDRWTVELMGPNSPTAIRLAQRMALEQGWLHPRPEDPVACPACSGELLQAPLTPEFCELLRSRPTTFGEGIIPLIRQVIGALNHGRPAPAAPELFRLGCQALSRCHPAEIPRLREVIAQLRPLLHNTRGIGPSSPPVEAIATYPSAMLVGMEIVDQNGLQYVVTEAHPEGSATIIIDGKVMGMVPVPAEPKIERIPPKSSWERLMEDDDDECL